MSRPSPWRQVARARRTATEAARLLARDPALVREVAVGLLPEPVRRAAGLGSSGTAAGTGVPGRAGGADSDAGAPAHVVPAEVTGHLRSVTARALLPLDAAAARELVADLGRQDAWLTLHAAWRGEAPCHAVEGGTHGQQLRIMGIPAEVAWTVMRVDDEVVALTGAGPMGLRLALAATVAPATGGARVVLDAGLSGDPVAGPLGASVTRSVGEALQASLGRLVSLAESSGAAPGGVPGEASGGAAGGNRRAAPVLHHASGRRLDPRTPVVVGVGQVVQRTPTPPWREPAELAVEALRRAAEDTAAADGAGLLAAADLVCAVASASWVYRDLAAEVAARLGAAPAATVQTARFGGDGGQLAVNEAGRAVAAGEASVVLVLGAESGATLATAQKAGEQPDWTEQPADVAPTRTLGSDREANTALEGEVGLGAPVYHYALVESALRARTGATPEEHRARITGLWSRLSHVAADNPAAWLPRAFGAEELATTGPDNRPVSSPYPKLLCANLQVDLASGLVVTSVAAAEAAGVPQEQWVFLHAGAAASDEWFVSERGDLAASPAIRAVGRAVLDHAGLDIADVRLVDLYSCFPAAVQVAAHELGLPLDDPDRPLSVTGGLTFAGGPGNGYGGHAVATMVQRLREDRDAVGLTTSLGWYLTKHAAGLLSARPPERAYAALAPVVAPEPRRTATGSWQGPAVVEACTVPYDRAGQPEAAIVAAVTPDGTRGLVRVTDPATVRRLDEGDPLGWTVELRDGALVVVEEGRAPVPPPPPLTVRTEDHGPVRVVTIDRPHRRNAVDLPTAELLERVFDGIEADPGVRVAVLTGAGGSFSAGMDLKAAAAGQLPITERGGPLGITARTFRTPVIAAVEGPALAGGCELALVADLVVAASDATFGLPEPKRGLVAAAGGVLRLTQRLPRAVALEMALTGDPQTAERMHAVGLVNRVVEPGGALAAALDLARRIAANAPLSVEVSREIALAAPSWSDEEAFDRQSDLAARALGSHDAAEGVIAFAEGREPVWQRR